MIMLDEKTEITLLGSWLAGKNREDIENFEAGIFSRRKLYKAVVAGKTPAQLMTEGLLEGVTITELLSQGMEYWSYTDARAQALTLQRMAYAEQIGAINGADTRDLTEKINTLDAVIRGEKYKPISEDLKQILFDDLDETENENNPQYGIKYLDMATGGIHRGQLTIIGARPRTGKSAIALQIAANVAEAGRKVLFIPLEMTVAENLKRILLYAQVAEPGEKIDRAAAGQYLDALEPTLKFCEGLTNIDGIEKTIKAEKPELVIIDQLSQLTVSGSHKDTREMLVLITRNLKRIALEYKVPLIVLSQINRDGAKQGRPGLENLAESDSSGQDADNVFILYEEEDADRDQPLRDITLLIAKQRNGATGKEIPLKFKGERFTFENVDMTQKTKRQQQATTHWQAGIARL